MSHACDGQGLISLDQALALYAEHVRPLPVSRLPLRQAHGHVLAEAAHAQVDLPLFTQSAVDGYALRQHDIDAGLRSFTLAGEVRAGIPADMELLPGQAIRIFTGGRLPAGADTVARQEITQAGPQHLHLQHALQKGDDIRYQGEELQRGSLLAERGTTLDAGLLAAMAMAGVQAVAVHRQPRIAVIITGDEVSARPLHEAQVFDANGPLISAWLDQAGLHQYQLWHVGDDAGQLQECLAQALQEHDLVLTTGGVSVGDYDLVRPLSLQLGAREVFWQVAQKPGKPLYFATFRQTGTGHDSYLLGLPGNPAAVYTGLPVHVQTVLNLLQGRQNPLPAWQAGRFSGRLQPDSRERLLRVRMDIDGNGQVWLHPLPKQQSHMLSNLATANALVRVSANTGFETATLLPFLPTR